MKLLQSVMQIIINNIIITDLTHKLMVGISGYAICGGCKYLFKTKM